MKEKRGELRAAKQIIVAHFMPEKTGCQQLFSIPSRTICSGDFPKNRRGKVRVTTHISRYPVHLPYDVAIKIY